MNLKEIVEFKSQFPEKVVLLLGDHDLTYYHYDTSNMSVLSNYRSEVAATLALIFGKHKNLFQYAWESNNLLFSHAGVTQQWLTRFLDKYYSKVGNSPEIHRIPLGEKINQASHHPYLLEKFILTSKRLHSKSKVLRGECGMTNVSFAELQEDSALGYVQVVGHTPTRRIFHSQPLFLNTNLPGITRTELFQCDCLDFKEEFLSLEVFPETMHAQIVQSEF